MIEPTDEMVDAAGRAILGERPINPVNRKTLRAAVTAVLALVERDQRHAARKGYETAIAVLRDVAERTGSPAASWCADYLAVDPDRLAPPPQ